MLLIGTVRDIGRRLLDGGRPGPGGAGRAAPLRSVPGIHHRGRPAHALGGPSSGRGSHRRQRPHACPSASSTSSSTRLPTVSAADFPASRRSGSRPPPTRAGPTRPPPIPPTRPPDHHRRPPCLTLTIRAGRPRTRRSRTAPGSPGAPELAAGRRPRRQRRHRLHRGPGHQRGQRDRGGRGAILTAGVAGLVAGAISMALGEYVSVSSQRDTERALLDKERTELATSPEEELDELTAIYVAKGASEATARPAGDRAHRQGRVRCPRRRGTGHRPGCARQPLARGGLLGDRVHPRFVLPLLAIVLSGPAGGSRSLVTVLLAWLSPGR